MKTGYCKLEIFIPVSHIEQLREALRRADAGHIGNYDGCLSFSEVRSTWRPLEGSRPFSGREGEISEETEYKVEVAVFREQLEKVLDAVYEVHPYEEPVVHIIPMEIRRRRRE